jgi:hypothetical protein
LLTDGTWVSFGWLSKLFGLRFEYVLLNRKPQTLEERDWVRDTVEFRTVQARRVMVPYKWMGTA